MGHAPLENVRNLKLTGPSLTSVVLGGGMLLTAKLVFSTFHSLHCSISPWDPTLCYAGGNDDQVADDLEIDKEFGERVS